MIDKHVIKKYGSMENFFNISANRTDCKSIDPALLNACKFLCNHGAHTVDSCCGHGKEKAHIAFASYVKEDNIKECLRRVDLPEYLLERVKHKHGNFYFYRLVFPIGLCIVFDIAYIKSICKEVT